jgi:hypothetical protein
MRTKQIKIVVTLVIVALLSMQHTLYFSLGSATSTPEELMRLDITVYSGDRIMLGLNTWLYFKYISTINTSSPGFAHFVSATYIIMPETPTAKMLNSTVHITIIYDQIVDQATVNVAANDLLAHFNHTSLDLLSQQGPTEENHTFTYDRLYGHLPTTPAVYVACDIPEKGFATLLQGFLDLYLPGNSTTGLFAYYSLLPDGFFEVSFGGATDQPITAKGQYDGTAELRLSSLFNSTSIIKASDYGQSEIMILIRNQGKCSSSPTFTPNYTRSENVYDLKEYFWTLTENQELQDVVTVLEVHGNIGNSGMPPLPVIAILAGLAGTLAYLIIIRVRRRRLEKTKTAKPKEASNFHWSFKS